ncbi:hypothetical protein G210_3725 [Candida maltosa Xu316]|uniref:RRM domain-containing protein n=1 Tax=Candida maltosa (strain Xu316) TaxID=1245528 RepID=M3JUK3_CANMX|nr:hypothetical protein G210_3725 [Candida maltosa Xu316]
MNSSNKASGRSKLSDRSMFNTNVSPFSPSTESDPTESGPAESDPADLNYQQSTIKPFVRKKTTSASPTDFNATPNPHEVIVTNIPQNLTHNDFLNILKPHFEDQAFFYNQVRFIKEDSGTYTAILKIPDLATTNKIISILSKYNLQGHVLEATLNINENSSMQPRPPQSQQSWRPLLSRNSSSVSSINSLFDQRRNSSRASKTSLSSYGSLSKRNSGNLSISSDTPTFVKKPVPPFIMNMVGSREESPNRHESISEDPEQESNNSVDENEEDDDEYIYIKAEESEDPEQMIKVNPTRLFVGNVPYRSTWSSLKQFLVDKSNELIPNNNISILRVEIPMQPLSRSTSMYFYQQSRPQPVVPKTRGFAIVTTGDLESSEKLIELFNNMEFEGRSLTVRFDKFPDYNNYTMQHINNPQHTQSSSSFSQQQQQPQYQQSYPLSSSSSSSSSMSTSTRSSNRQLSFSTDPSLLTSLAFQRNSYQRDLYFASTGHQQSSSSPSPSQIGLPQQPPRPHLSMNQYMVPPPPPPPNAANYSQYPPPPPPQYPTLPGGSNSPSQTYMYWAPPFFPPGAMYAPMQYSYQQSPQSPQSYHYQQFTPPQFHQVQYQPPYNRESFSASPTITPKREEEEEMKKTESISDDEAEKEKARALMNSIKDLSIDK